MKRYLKKIEAVPDLDRRRFDREAGIPGLLAATERSIALELAGWKGSRDDVLLTGTLQDYYRELARRGLLIVHEIWFGSELAASHLGVLDGERMLALRIAYDERYADTSPGHMLTLWTVKDAADRGCRFVDLGGTSGATYKTIWTDQWTPVGPYTLFAPSVRGRLVAFAIERARPALGRARARLRRSGQAIGRLAGRTGR
jgi:CelD/BcsL family acetyltransferase involved in cellulose biosynthesis